ncbi:MAG: acyl-CoA thioesterase [Bacteroidetes bacterium]|nr:acyl-CoA thioesterase [Bacteroidota bacterium]
MHNISLFKHRLKLKIRFSDLDAMHHVNNATYLTYLEEARIAYFNDVLSLPKNSLDFGAVIARIEIDYLHQISLGDELEILTRISKFGTKSANVENLIIIKSNDENIVAAAANTKLVYFDYKKGESKKIPEQVKLIVEKYEKLSS